MLIELCLWIIFLFSFSVSSVLSGFCHDFLVGGPGGVDNAFTGYGTHSHRYTPPHHAYLYGSTSNRYYAAAWCAKTTYQDMWLQADLQKDMVIKAVVTRGSPNTDRVTYNRAHVTKFALKYKADGEDWITFTDDQGTTKNFTGNTKDLKMKENYFQKIVTARYVRIYPIEWVFRCCIQFDLIGCAKETTEKDKNKNWQASLHKTLPSNDGLLWEQNMKNHAFCGKLCFEDESCISFTFDSADGKCQGYDRQLLEKTNTIASSNVFFKRIYSACGYGEWKYSGQCIKTYLFKANMSTADTICRQNGAYLGLISSNETAMTIWAENKKNKITATEFAFYVSGTFDENGGLWRLQNGQEIQNEAWSENEPDPSNGKCVFLHSDGLISGQCTGLHWFICSKTLSSGSQ